MSFEHIFHQKLSVSIAVNSMHVGVLHLAEADILYDLPTITKHISFLLNSMHVCTSKIIPITDRQSVIINVKPHKSHKALGARRQRWIWICLELTKSTAA